jgi:hypothetical protein
MREPFAWGLRKDCTVACVAFARLHGVDSLATASHTYKTALGAARILNRFGGYAGWCDATFDLPRTDSPGPGDLALIESADAFGAALGLCIQPGEFAIKTESGMTIAPATILKGWTCPSSLR